MAKKKAKKKSEKTSKENKETKTTPKKSKKQNYWVFTTVLVSLLLIVSLLYNLSGNICTAQVISSEQAGQKALEVAESLGVDPSTMELIDVTEENSLYNVVLEIQGQEAPLYITKDGKSFIPQAIPIAELKARETQQQPPQQQQQQETQQTTYTEEDLEKLGTFNNCLAEKGVKIYGANWCGWTKKWVVDTLGGFDIVSAIYIECTEDQELCAQEEVTGYPTTKINGEIYSDSRTIEAIAQETGCPAPQLTGNTIDSTNQNTGSC